MVKVSLTGTDRFLQGFTASTAGLALLIFTLAGQIVNQRAPQQCTAKLPDPRAHHLVSQDMLQVASSRQKQFTVLLAPVFGWASRAFLNSQMFCFQQRAFKQEIKINAIDVKKLTPPGVHRYLSGDLALQLPLQHMGTSRC